MKALQHRIQQVVRDILAVDVAIDLQRTDPQFGDFATNVALQLAKQLGKNPREIAQELAVGIKDACQQDVAEVSVAGPGFINIRMRDAWLTKQLHTKSQQLTVSGKVVLVEYSDPNPFKPLHAGHLYTTLVGNTIARLIERSGAKVVRINYGGDVGLHVGKAMWAILQNLEGEYPERLRDIPEKDRASWLGQRYVEGNAAYEDDEQSRQAIVECNKKVYTLHSSGDRDSSFAQIYWTCRDWSYAYFKQLYKQLQVDPFDRFIPESEVTPLGVATIQQQQKHGVYTESQGAVVYDGESKGLHTRVFINSEGLPTYEAKEVGLIQTKWNDYAYDSSVIVTANEQDQYMQVVLASIAEFEPELVRRTTHITHGVVKLAGGVKMSSRKGNVVTAVDIIDAAREAAAKTGKKTSESTVLAAIKYAFAKNRIGGDIVYDPNDSVALEGNSGPYLQYAHARARSILQKARGDMPTSTPDSYDEAERKLAAKLTEYNEVVQKAENELAPHLVCAYLYELAQVFNRFYEANRVIGHERETIRRYLVAVYADTLRDGLELLGIDAPEKM